MIVQVDVQVACDDKGLPESNEIQSWVRHAISVAASDVTGEVEITVRIVDSEEIQALNREFRQQDRSTNVLSFPAGLIEGLPAAVPKALGDIVICAQVVSDEATEQGKASSAHWAHMVVHGTLHLLGFDHVDENEAIEMEGQESRILTKLGVADPYGESRET